MEAGGVRELLALRWFRRLYATRLASQAADGVFQASLASAVFFNPEHQTDPRRAAAGFVVLLLPYSLVGPVAGVFLDRWRRQRVLVCANAVRTAFIAAAVAVLLALGSTAPLFYVVALVALSVNRFYLATLSAALPHAVPRHQLLRANALTTTTGTFVTILGGGAGLFVRRLAGAGDRGSAVVAAASTLGYVAAALVAASMPRDLLGPGGSAPALRVALRRVGRDVLAGAAEVRRHPRTLRALGVIGGSRLLFGMSTIGSLLLYRNYFSDGPLLKAGLVGLGQAFAASAVGYVAAAVLTPPLAGRLGTPRWIVVVLGIAGVSQVAFGLPFAKAPLLAGAFVLGATAQSAKICVDTVVQEDIGAPFRGRVFSFYDTVFNLTFVLAALAAGFVLPVSGKSYPVLLAIGAGYLLLAVGYAATEPAARRLTEPGSTPAPSEAAAAR